MKSNAEETACWYHLQMRPDRLPHPQSLIPLLNRLSDKRMDLELFILKCHLIAERQLYSLLASRLGTEDRHLPPLQFWPLAKLALGGSAYHSTLLEVQALNDLRNEYSHEIESKRLGKAITAFAERTGTFCPSPQLSADNTLDAAHDSSVRIAGLLCIGDVWVHITEVSLEKALYSTESQAAAASQELSSTKKMLLENRQEQRRLKSRYPSA